MKKQQSAAAVEKHFLDAENRLIALLYESVLEPNFFNTFMCELCKVIDARSGTLGINNVISQEVRGGWSWNVSLEYLDIYLSGHFAAKDRLIEHLLTAAPGQFYSIMRDLDDAETYVTESQVYREWAIPQDIHDVAGALVYREGNWISFLTIQRKKSQGHYSEQECRLLNRLIPHIRRALQLHQNMVNLKQLKQPLKEVLEMIHCPVMVFNERFEVAYSNQLATNFIERADGVSLEDNNLVFVIPEINSGFAFKVMESVKMSAGIFSAEASMYRVEGEEPFTVLFFPIRGRDSESEMKIQHSGTLAFFHGLSRDLVLPPALVDSFQLTPAEAELCAGLVAGRSISDLAKNTGKSEQTLRSHAKSLYSKTASNSQVEMVASILSNPLFMGTL